MKSGLQLRLFPLAALIARAFEGGSCGRAQQVRPVSAPRGQQRPPVCPQGRARQLAAATCKCLLRFVYA